VALDTKYRPINYSDVLGQDSTVEVLRQFIREGRGFHQSYIFCGQHGSGKTTMGRILARALLCEAHVDGEPCNQCTSCLSILERGSSECFVELDAATKSGKSDVTKITEDVTYSTFSGKRRIYLFDECFTEDTVLLTRAGFRSIRTLVEERFTGDVLSFDTDTQEKVWRPVTAWFDLGSREVITLEFDNGVELTVTTNQEIYTHNRGWVEAAQLTEQDDVEETSFQTMLYKGLMWLG
jgi:DNA polymerase III delta prime subunit